MRQVGQPKPRLDRITRPSGVGTEALVVNIDQAERKHTGILSLKNRLARSIGWLMHVPEKPDFDRFLRRERGDEQA